MTGGITLSSDKPPQRSCPQITLNFMHNLQPIIFSCEQVCQKTHNIKTSVYYIGKCCSYEMYEQDHFLGQHFMMDEMRLP